MRFAERISYSVLYSAVRRQVTCARRLQGREIADVHDALVAGWRRLREGQGPPVPSVQSLPDVANNINLRNNVHRDEARAARRASVRAHAGQAEQ